ncbi:Thioredoxin H-type [Linum grandiflorum]
MGGCFAKNQKEDDDESEHPVEFVGGNVKMVPTEESWKEYISEASKDGKTIVVNFSASWCGPCRMIAPFYTELSEKYPSLVFLAVDVDELTELSTSWEIKATPTFFFLRDGKQVDKLVGANRPELQKKIASAADSAIAAAGRCE